MNTDINNKKCLGLKGNVIHQFNIVNNNQQVVLHRLTRAEFTQA